MKIIAELCQNHGGNFDTVKKMVDEAAEGGASHIKLQHIYVSNLVYRAQFEQGLEVDGTVKAIKRPWHNEYERLKSLELSDKECEMFVSYVKSLGLTPMTTCFARGDISRISEQGYSEIKVASYDCASFQLLKELAPFFDHIYVSTGATFDDEIAHAADTLKMNAKSFSFLHCVTQYPTPLSQMNLNRISYLNQFCQDVGFSDHSHVERDGIIAAKAAIACGAMFVERHFTIDSPDKTKDGPVSIRKEHIRQLIEFSKLSPEDQKAQLADEYPNWEVMLGSEYRWLTVEELLNRDYYRGRFATPRKVGLHNVSTMIQNWEETPIG